MTPIRQPTPPSSAIASIVRYQRAASGHRVHSAGASNIHDWSGTSDQINGWLDLPGQWIKQDGAFGVDPRCSEADRATARLHFQLPVISLEGNHPGLANHMHSALKASKHSHITFSLNTLVCSPAPNRCETAWAAVGNRFDGDLGHGRTCGGSAARS